MANITSKGWKTESFSSKIMIKARMPTPATSTQYNTGSSNQSQTRKLNKKHENWKRRNENICVHI